MDRNDIAIVVNSCPKYFYMLPYCFGLLRRYAPHMKWPVYFATEEPDHEIVKHCVTTYSIQILTLEKEYADFFSSRKRAMDLLPQEIQYVLPLQEDFLLERPGPNWHAIQQALCIFDAHPHIASIRIMPCPGSKSRLKWQGTFWHSMNEEDMLFSYQATLWKRTIYSDFMKELISHTYSVLHSNSNPSWNSYAVQTNPAETVIGETILKGWNYTHLCCPREGTWANAVYLSPWPYRPTAIVKGIFQPWAIDLLRREGFNL